MNVKIASLLTVAAIISIMAGVLIYRQAPKEEILEGRFGIYLENDELVISDNDIMWYNKTSHEIKLTGEGFEKIKALRVFVRGEPFAVKLDNRVIYTGSFWSMVSSIPYSGVVIRDFLIKNNVIEISAGYPGFVGIDPRNDNEIFDYFQKIGKLIQ